MRLPPPITSRSNGKVKALRAAFAGKAAHHGEMSALEGEHLLIEASAARISLHTLYIREGAEIALHAPSLRELDAREQVVLARDIFDAAVDTATPQGLAATFAIPEQTPIDVHQPAAILVLENLQDPGNVGTLVRSAAAFGAGAVLLVGESANPWSPKVLRASAGAVFRVPVARLTLSEAAALLRPARRLLAAVPNHPGAVPATEAPWDAPAIMIGNEGRGLTAEALALADAFVTIPCKVESLNAAVAGSVLLYESLRQATERTPQAARESE